MMLLYIIPFELVAELLEILIGGGSSSTIDYTENELLMLEIIRDQEGV